MYATFDDYNSFAVTKISKDIFDIYYPRAEKLIDYLTFNRIKKLSAVSNDVKIAVCAVIETYVKYSDKYENTAQQNGIKSENADGYSVTYIESNTNNIEKQIIDTAIRQAKMYLSGTGLLYRGC